MSENGGVNERGVTERDQPWLMRTYSGHSTATASNELYRTNLAKGQTGLSIAFDLPTQTGYDPDSPMAQGEVGKVGVPVAHLGHMRTLLDGIPPGADEHVDDDQRDRGVAARRSTSPTPRSRASPSSRSARHDAERHRQGVPVARHLHLPARAEPPVDRRHGRLVARITRPSGTRSTSAATTCKRRARRRCRRSRTRSRPRSACSTPCASRVRSSPSGSPRCSARSRSS